MPLASAGGSSASRQFSIPTIGQTPPSLSVAVPELSGLNSEDIELIEAVISRAGAAATTFLPVFKAYSDVLHERGLDQHEVVYYGKLLKLGTLKGRNWGEKWNLVKLQNGHGDLRSRTTAITPHPTTRIQTRNPQLQDDDTSTSYSYQDNLEYNRVGTVPEDIPRFSLGQRAQIDLESKRFSALSSGVINGSDSDFPHSHVISSLLEPQDEACDNDPWDAQTSDVTGPQVPSNLATPPSYNAAVRNPILRKQYVPGSKDRPLSVPHVFSPPRHPLPLSTERRGNVMSDDDTWSKIKMRQDQIDADLFRKDKQIERCWEVWKRSLRWIRVRLSPPYARHS